MKEWAPLRGRHSRGGIIMGFFFLCLIVVAVVATKRRKPKTARLLYSQGRLENDVAVFSCGCRFSWAHPDEPPTICQAHRAIIDAEVTA